MDDDASKEKSFQFAMMHLRRSMEGRDEQTVAQVLLEAIGSGAVEAAQEVSKTMRDSLFAPLVRDEAEAAELFCNWDLSHLLVAVGMTRLPSLPCAYIKHVLQPLPRPLSSIAMLHASLQLLVAAWWRTGATVADDKLRGTPLLVLLRWMFCHGPRRYADGSAEARQAMGARLGVVHPKKQLVEYVMMAESADTAHDSPWSLQLAPTFVMVRNADEMDVLGTLHATELARVRASVLNFKDRKVKTDRLIRHLEWQKCNVSPASVYNQSVLAAADSDDENGLWSLRLVSTVQLLSHGTRDVRVVREVHAMMKKLQLRYGGDAADEAIGFHPEACELEMQRSFSDIEHHGRLPQCANLDRLMDLALYWFDHVWARVDPDLLHMSRIKDELGYLGIADDDRSRQPFTSSLRAWLCSGVVTQERMRTHLLQTLQAPNAARMDKKRQYGVWYLLHVAIKAGNTALAQVALDAVRTSETGPDFKSVTGHFGPVVLPTCLRKCPGIFKDVLEIVHDVYTQEVIVEVLYNAILCDIPEAVALLLDKLPDGSLPAKFPPPGSLRMLPWLMRDHPAYMLKVLEKGGEWGRKDYEELLRQCDPNRATDWAMAEWLMMPPRSLDPLPDKPWLQCLNQRLYVPGGPGYNFVASRHTDLDGSEHAAKLGLVSDASTGPPNPPTNVGETSVPAKRVRTD